MLRNLIVLPDGTELWHGLSTGNAIQSITVNESVNVGTELSPGSVYSNWIEATLITAGGQLYIPVGTEVTLYKVDDSEERTKVGLFTLESPERSNRNAYKITAYDRISWLDRDISTFLSTLDAWPYPMLTLAQMICKECLLTLTNTEIPNGDFPVSKFSASSMTAREVLGYIGELAGRFCRATPDGDIEFAWYEDSGVTLSSTGDRYYFSLKYEDYLVEKIDSVHVQLADDEYGLLFPEAADTANAYIISGNPLVTTVNDSLLPYLEVLRKELQYAIYTPCRVTIPAAVDIRPGHIVRITDGNGLTLDTYVMTRTQKGNTDTLESTGSARRDRPTVVTGKTAQDYANAAVKRQTQLELFNKLTNYGAVQGLFLEENGQIFINAAYISTGILQSKDGKTFYLDLDEGVLEMDAKTLSIGGKSLGAAALEGMSQAEIVAALTADGAAEGIYLSNGQLYINAEYILSGTLNASLIKAGVLQSNDNGETFKLDLENGTFSMSGAGKFMAEDGNSYITVDGGAFVLYAKNRYGTFEDIARIGFSEDSDGADYPYILLGHADGDDDGSLSLIKRFSNGVYLGNSVPRLNTGTFVGQAGAVGFFIDTEEGKPYSVNGEDLQYAFTAVFG